MSDLTVTQHISDALRGSMERLANLMSTLKTVRAEYTKILAQTAAARDVREAQAVRDRIGGMPE
jgi:hypothetical protein